MRKLTFHDILSIARLCLRREKSLDNQIAEFFMKSKQGNIVVLNRGRSAMQALIDDFNLHNSEMILPSWICSDVFVPLLMQNKITPRIIDCKKNSVHMDFNQARAAITTKTKSLVLVHTYGIPKDIEKYRELCDERGIVLIEDCAHALQVPYNNSYLGSYGDAAIFSFVKEIPCFSGGAYLNNRKSIEKTLFNSQSRISSFREDAPLLIQKLPLSGLLQRALKRKINEPESLPNPKKICSVRLSKVGKAVFCALLSKYVPKEKRITGAALYSRFKKSAKGKSMLFIRAEELKLGSAKCVPLLVHNKKETIAALEHAGFNPGRGWIPCFSTNSFARTIWKLPQTPCAEYYEKHLVNIDLDEINQSNIEKFSAILEEVNA
mgnify:FL=1